MPDAEVDKVSADITVTSPPKEEQVEAAGPNQKQRTVSFNRDVHVKRIAPNRAAPAAPAVDAVRRQPLAGLSRQELAKEAAKVLAQASSVRCSSTSPPDKFFSLPTRRKYRPDPSLSNPPARRRSEELGVTTDLPTKNLKTSLNRSTSDVTSKKNRRNTTTIFNIFKKPDQNDSATKDNVLVKRSKSDVSDLKSSGIRPIRKRTGSESEEYLNSVIGKKSQLSPIIEINPSEDYFKNAKVETTEYKINPIEKPPRTIEPKPPSRPKRIKNERPKPVKAAVKHFDTLPKSKITNQKRILVDETDIKNISEIKKSIKKTLEQKTDLEMIHSSQKPPEKLPLTKGQTVDTMVKILNQDKFATPPKTNLMTSPSTAAHNNNQPFSYTRPTSISPDPNLYARSASPDRPPSPVNRMNQEQGRGVIYAQVVCGENGRGQKQTVHHSVTPDRQQKFGHNSDEDEGLGYEDNRYRSQHDYPYRYSDDYTHDSPITPKFKEFKSHKFIGDEYEESEDTMRGRGDGMDARRRESLLESEDTKYEKKIAELSHRRELLENRFNARRNRDVNSPGNDAGKYVSESTTVYTTDKNNVTSGYTDKYVSDTRRNKDGTLNKVEERTRSKFNPDTAMFESVGADELDRREFIDKRLAEEPSEIKYFSQKPSRYFPPEPDYEPPSLDSQNSAPKYSPEARKYKPKRVYTSSHEGLHTASRYNAKYKHEKFGNTREHYASNPEIVQKSHRDEYDGPETFHNSLRRQRYNSSDKHYRNQDDYLEQSSSRSLRQQNSDNRYGGETSGPESSKGRYDNDRDRENKFADSGIENDYRKDSNGDIHSRGVVSPSSKDNRTRRGDFRNESEDEGFASSLLIASERQHTEDNHHPVKAKYQDNMRSHREEFVHREKSIDDGSFYDPRLDKFEERSHVHHRIEAKPPKVVKKISGLEKVKQLFSRDSSKKSKKDKDKRIDDNSSSSQSRDSRKISKDDELRRRYTDYRETYDEDHRRTNVSRTSDLEIDSRINPGRYSRSSKIKDDEDSSYMDADYYSQRRRMATPTPSPSPPRRTSRNSETLIRKEVSRKPASTSSSGWFKSLDRLSSRNKTKVSKNDKDSVLTTTEEESTLSPKRYNSSTAKKGPTKSLRFFGDTDQESNGSVSKNVSTLRQRPKISEPPKYLNRNAKKLSNSAHALNKTDYTESKYRSSSLTNLQNGLDSRQNLLVNSYNKEKYGSNKRGLHNISEIHSNSETESQFEEREKYHEKENGDRKPPMSPMREKRRSRSHSGTKITKNGVKNGYHSSRGDLTDDTRLNSEVHSSKHDLRGSRQELTSSRNDLRTRRRRMITGATSPADSSTEGDSSHQSQRSIVYLHAPTVGDIPSTGRISRGRSRDDVSSVNSSLQPHTKTVSRSFSVLAPWKPRMYREGYDINYSQSGHQSTIKRNAVKSTPPPKKESGLIFGKSKSASTKNLSSSKYDRSTEERPMPNKSSTLTRYANKDDNKTSSNGTLFRKSRYSSSKENVNGHQMSTMSRGKNDPKIYKKSMSTEVLSRDSPPKGTKRSSVERERLSRSISMPKDPNKSAGWFKISKKSKKIENSSRVY